MRDLEAAWAAREKAGWLTRSEAVRVFHGPGEASGPDLESIAIDRFGPHFWVTEWEREGAQNEAVAEKISAFLLSKGARSAVALWRPERGVPSLPERLLGAPPTERFACSEEGGAQFWIDLVSGRHPGLFLDHAPLRRWLEQNSQGLSVLNAFAYTGSLSVAAGRGGAREVTTLDLSKPSIAWARANWELSRLPEAGAQFVAGDVFEWLPRFKKQGRSFDCVILDPPSFSRGEKASFSTAKDLPKLHALALALTAPGGLLVTSINSASIPAAKFEAEVQGAVKAAKRSAKIVRRIELPDTFPTRAGDPRQRYLKGLILKTD